MILCYIMLYYIILCYIAIVDTLILMHVQPIHTDFREAQSFRSGEPIASIFCIFTETETASESTS